MRSSRTRRPRFEALRKFCEYYIDRGQHATCCAVADPEIVASEPEAYDCDTCEHRQHIEGLDAENRDAWKFYAALKAHRWVWQWDLGAWYLGQLCEGMDEDEREALFARISVIYDTFHPHKA